MCNSCVPTCLAGGSVGGVGVEYQVILCSARPLEAAQLSSLLLFLYIALYCDLLYTVLI